MTTKTVTRERPRETREVEDRQVELHICVSEELREDILEIKRTEQVERDRQRQIELARLRELARYD